MLSVKSQAKSFGFSLATGMSRHLRIELYKDALAKPKIKTNKTETSSLSSRQLPMTKTFE